ncbi:Tfp pilus assembly protein PilX [Paraburkholderia sp. Clong3]
MDRGTATQRGRAYDICGGPGGTAKHLGWRNCQGGARRAHQRGVVLAIVLLISAMMLATSAIWFETSLAAARAATNVRDYLQAFHAADSALSWCERNVLSASGDAPDAPLTSGEPTQWRLETAFDAGAITPVAQWPGSSRAPQCLIEPWRLASRPNASAYLLTARGFGRSSESQIWLQMEVVTEDGAIERHWRRVAARPF